MSRLLPYGVCPAFAAGICAVLVTVNPAHSAQVSSQYSKFDLSDCKTAPPKKNRPPQTLICQNGNGPNVVYNDNHAHPYIRFEPWFSQGRYDLIANADGTSYREPTDFQSISAGPGFSDLFKNSKGQVTFEWRVENSSGAWRPFAMIVRTTGHINGKTTTYLRVAKLADDQSCAIALINADTIKNHNIVARRLADQRARMFDCNGDTELILNTPHEAAVATGPAEQ